MIVRLKVFIPVCLVLALIVFVVIYKIDGWLTRWIENGISAVTDTKTDISSLRLSFKKSSLRIKRLEIASSEDEWKNAVEFEDIVIDFQSLPLLQKRFVIDNFSILGVAWGTKRTTSGKLPPKPPSPPSWISKKFDEAFASLQKEMAELPVSKMLDFDIPKDPREIVNALDLKSVAAFKSSMTTAQDLKSQWTGRIQDLRDFSEYERRIGEARKLVQNTPANPQEILKSIETLKETYEFFEKEKKRAEGLIKDVEGDAKKIQTEFDSAQRALEADFERAKKAFSLEALNVNNLSRTLFGPEWIARAEMVLRYHKLLRKYMASKPADETVEVKKRAKGRDIIFVTPRRQPSFVLAKSEFSVKGIEQGDRKLTTHLYQLKLKDLNSAPKLYGKPSEVDFKAEFKNAILNDVVFRAFWDYVGEVDKDEFTLAAHRIKAESWPIGIPKVFPIKMASGLANAKTDLKFEGDTMKWVSKVGFQEIAWDLNEVPKRGIITPILEEVFKQVKDFDLELELKSTDQGLDFDIRSTIDNRIKEGIDAGVRKQVAEFQDRIRKEVEGRVAAYKDQALKQVTGFQGDVKEKISSFVQKTTSYKDEVNQLQDRLKKKGEEAAQEKIKENLPKNVPGLPNPLKGLKRPF